MQTILRVLVLALVALQTDPGRDALRIGRTTDQTVYDAFSAGYQLAASGPVARAEVITEFRRAVLLVRERAEQGEYGFTERDLDRALAPYRGLVTVVAEIRLNPLNTYVTPPAFNLYIRTGPSTRPLPPDKFARTPIYAVAFGGPGSPLSGVRLEGTFSVADVSSAAAPAVVVVNDRGDIIWDARLDLSRFR